MRIYLAARYERRAELESYAQVLRTRGHYITSRWVTGSHDVGAWEQRPDADLLQRGWAEEDWADIKEAQALVAFTEAPRSAYGRGGRMVELGAALAWKKKVLIVGPRENVFCYLKEVEHYDTWADALAGAKSLQVAKGGQSKTPIFKDVARRLLANRGRQTSMDAILALGSTVNLQELIYWYLMTHGPSTDDEIKDYFDQKILKNGRPRYDQRTYVARRIELMHQNLVVETGEKRKTHKGNEAIVWAAVPLEDEEEPPQAGEYTQLSFG